MYYHFINCNARLFFAYAFYLRPSKSLEMIYEILIGKGVSPRKVIYVLLVPSILVTMAMQFD